MMDHLIIFGLFMLALCSALFLCAVIGSAREHLRKARVDRANRRYRRALEQTYGGRR